MIRPSTEDSSEKENVTGTFSSVLKIGIRINPKFSCAKIDIADIIENI